MKGGEGAYLRALRKARGWDVPRLAHEFRQAADEPLPASLDQMIRAWESGRFTPSERYEFLYRKVFGNHEPADVLESAARPPGRAEIAGMQAAALRSGRTDLVRLADGLMSLQRQIDTLAASLERALRDEAAGDE